ncbi:MAG: hypothetical protein EOO08_08345 [Chitinophagaceae bacterium]|nr:MAG: hypothetical protein EOO08_08345 [Chitinophagaceae bacterium]
MEQHRNRDEQSPTQNEQRNGRSGAPTGFEGMNFEEQRGTFKNSDGAGVSYTREQSRRERNGRSAPEE